MKKIYKVKNISGSERQFRDNHKGKWIVLKPKETVLTTSPPEQPVFKVEEYEQKEQRKHKEVK